MDIKDLLSTSPSPPPSKTTESRLFSRLVSVPSTHSHSPTHPLPSSTCITSHSSPPTVPASSPGQYQRQQDLLLLPQPISISTTSQAVLKQNPDVSLTATAPNKRRLPTEERPTGSPLKKRLCWTKSENDTISQLRGSGMSWKDISKQLPGRTATSCRLHQQNYLNSRSKWNEEKRTRLVRVYERYVFTSLFDNDC